MSVTHNQLWSHAPACQRHYNETIYRHFRLLEMQIVLNIHSKLVEEEDFRNYFRKIAGEF